MKRKKERNKQTNKQKNKKTKKQTKTKAAATTNGLCEAIAITLYGLNHSKIYSDG